MNLLTKSYHIYTNFYNDKTEPYVRVVKADKLGIKTLTKKIDLWENKTRLKENNKMELFIDQNGTFVNKTIFFVFKLLFHQCINYQ